MGSIGTAIELQDNFTSVLMNIMSVVDLTVTKMEQMQAAMSSSADVTGIQEMRNQLNYASAAAHQLESAIQNVSMPAVDVQAVPITFPVKPVVVSQPEIKTPNMVQIPVEAVVVSQPEIKTPDMVQIPVEPVVISQPEIKTPDMVQIPVEPVVVSQPEIKTPDAVTIDLSVSGVSETEQQIADLTNKLNGVAAMQQAIDETGKKLYILPGETIKDITTAGREIARMQQAIEFLKENPFHLDASIAELQVSAISDSLDAIIAKQGQMDTLMGNVPSQMVELSPEPVEIPVHWESYKGVDVFTNTGMERFEQEVASVNSMMERLSETQTRLTQQANESEILSPQASYDIQSVGNRIQELVGLINQAENSSLNIGTEEANTQLERLRMQLNQTLQLQNDLDGAMQDMDISEINTAYLRLSQNVADTERLVRDSFSDVHPVEIPVHWETDTMPVFTNTGIDRFRQEIQSANEMMEQLSSMQDTIARQAYNTNLFPPESFQNLNRLAVRIDSIRTHIRQIENQPMNIGTEMANAGLEQLRGQLNQALQEQQNLNHAMESMDVSEANEAYLRLSQTVGNTERYIRDNVDEQGRFNRAIEDGATEANGLMQTIKNAAAAYATIQSFSAALNLSDQMVSTTARLNMMNDGLQTTQDLQNMIFLSAERSRASYQETADAVSKLGLMAGNAFSGNQEVIAFMEQINKQFVIAGTEAAGIDAAMLQLTQAMSSGVLRGEEFNSIFEQAPNIIQGIAKYIEENEGVLNSVANAMDMNVQDLAGNVQGHLKDIASEGLLSAELVKNAVFYMSDETNAKFESMPVTFAQLWTSFQRNALMTFQPVLQRLNEIANNESFQGFVSSAVNGLSTVAGIALQVFDLLGNTAEFAADHWSILSPIIYGVAGALAVYYGAMLLYNTITAVSTGIIAAKAFAEKVHAAALGMQTGATFAATVQQYGFNAALLACPITWIVVGILALIAVIIILANHFSGAGHIAQSAFGAICGSVNVGIQFFKNLLFTVLDVVFGIVAAIGACGQNIMTAFYNALCSVRAWWYDLLSDALIVIEAICKALNKLPFVNFDYSGISNAADDYAARAAEATDNKREYVSIFEAFGSGMSTFDIFQDGWVREAYQAGASWGDGITDKVDGFFSGMFGDDVSIPQQEDYTDLSNYGDGLVYGLDKISGDTEKISDAVDITEEDLKYLRDIAEQETINRFTTAEITIEQTNHNSVSEKMDLDGVVDGLTEAVGEAADIIAEGVYE